MSKGKTIIQALAELENTNSAGAVCTIIRSRGSTPRHTGSKMLVYEDGSIFGSVGGGELENRVIDEALACIHDATPRLLEYNMNNPGKGDPGVCGGQVEVFVEPIVPTATIVVIGAGHVGIKVVQLAKWLGFHVVVNDDRAEFCNQEMLPDADELFPIPMSEFPAQYKITPWTYIVLTTRGVDVDVEGLPSLLDTDAAYIGVIGSRKRWKTTVDQLVEKGITIDQMDRVRSPIGLELNAETPEEIAVSILAEIIMLRYGGDGSVMSEHSK